MPQKKFNPFGKKEYYPTVVFVRCKCGWEMTIRTDTAKSVTSCWGKGCSRQIQVNLGMGKNNLSVYILEGGKKPEKWTNYSYNQ